MPTLRATILTALHARLSVLSATALRGEVLPEPIPAHSLLILHDGKLVEAEDALLGLPTGTAPRSSASDSQRISVCADVTT